MESCINGWPLIARLLYRRRKNQSDLARLLKVSPAAVTQLKHGDYRLSGVQLEKILDYLHATDDEYEELYSLLIPARLFGKSAHKFVCKAVISRVGEEEPPDDPLAKEFL